MSSKTTKRKRASAAAAPEVSGRSGDPAPAAVELGSGSAAPVAGELAPTPAAVEAIAAVEAAPAIATVADATDHASIDQGPTVSLASNHTIKDAAAFKDSLLQVFDEPGAVAIDAKSVERIDTAVMQLLCAFVRDRAARGHAVSFSRPTPAFLDAARLLGVSTLLALPAVDGGVAK